MQSLVIEPLRANHFLENFDCGSQPLNRFLKHHALQSQYAGASKTYMAVRGGDVVGYYTLVFGQVAFEDAPERLRKGVARHPVPLMILARLAVASASTGQRLGSGLLKDAMIRALTAADIAGLRALAVHAKDDDARSFYEHFNFVPSASNPLHLFMLLKDIRAALGALTAS